MAARIVQILRNRAELVVLAVLLIGTRLLNDPAPGGILGLGVVSGAAVALQAIGIVLVYRANRIINFAQVHMGLLAGALFFQLAQRRTFLLAVRTMCPPCVPEPKTYGELLEVSEDGAGALAAAGIPPETRLPDNFAEQLPSGFSMNDLAVRTAPDWANHVNFWLSIIVSMSLVIGVSWLVYVLLVRRFDRAPRLIATVMTIGLGQVFAVLASQVGRLFGDAPDEETAGLLQGAAAFPLELTMRIDPVNFRTGDILFVITAAIALVGLTIFFTRSAIGVVLRASSENPDRARTLGVNVAAVTSVAWMLAGALSGAASIIANTGVGVGGAANEVRYLAAAVIGGMVSIPITAVAALVLGVVEQSARWSITTPGFMDGVLLLIIVVVLLVQRSRSSRADAEADGGWKSAREARPIPHELRDLEVVRRWTRTARTVGVIAVLGLPWVLSPSQTNLAAVTLIYGIVALSLLILTGWAGQISLGQFGLAAVGGWVAAVTGLPFPLSILLGGVGGALVAVAIGVPALRLRGLHLAISTLAFAGAVTAVLLNPRYLGGLLPETLDRPVLLGLRLDDQRTFYYFALTILIVTVFATIGMRRSRIARALLASRENEVAAQAFGINLLRARLVAFACSGFMAAVAGAMYAYSQYGVHAAAFGYEQSIKMFLMVVIGGLGSIAGPLIGAGFVGIADIIGQDVPLFAIGATGVGTVALLLFMPGGLGEAMFAIRDAMLRRVADRYRIEVPSLIADRKARGARAAILPKARVGGGTVFVPPHYRAEGQWSIEARHKEAVGG